jgi:hypothetical protein
LWSSYVRVGGDVGAPVPAIVPRPGIIPAVRRRPEIGVGASNTP